MDIVHLKISGDPWFATGFEWGTALDRWLEDNTILTLARKGPPPRFFEQQDYCFGGEVILMLFTNDDIVKTLGLSRDFAYIGSTLVKSLEICRKRSKEYPRALKRLESSSSDHFQIEFPPRVPVNSFRVEDIRSPKLKIGDHFTPSLSLHNDQIHLLHTSNIQNIQNVQDKHALYVHAQVVAATMHGVKLSFVRRTGSSEQACLAWFPIRERLIPCNTAEPVIVFHISNRVSQQNVLFRAAVRASVEAADEVRKEIGNWLSESIHADQEELVADSIDDPEGSFDRAVRRKTQDKELHSFAMKLNPSTVYEDLRDCIKHATSKQESKAYHFIEKLELRAKDLKSLADEAEKGRLALSRDMVEGVLNFEKEKFIELSNADMKDGLRGRQNFPSKSWIHDRWYNQEKERLHRVYTARLDNLESEIIGMTWYSQKELQKQCESIWPTIQAYAGVARELRLCMEHPDNIDRYCKISEDVTAAFDAAFDAAFEAAFEKAHEGSVPWDTDADFFFLVDHMRFSGLLELLTLEILPDWLLLIGKLEKLHDDIASSTQKKRKAPEEDEEDGETESSDKAIARERARRRKLSHVNENSIRSRHERVKELSSRMTSSARSKLKNLAEELLQSQQRLDQEISACQKIIQILQRRSLEESIDGADCDLQHQLVAIFHGSTFGGDNTCYPYQPRGSSIADAYQEIGFDPDNDSDTNFEKKASWHAFFVRICGIVNGNSNSVQHSAKEVQHVQTTAISRTSSFNQVIRTDETAKLFINPTKGPEERIPFTVFMGEHAELMQYHQIEGAQFIWREIVEGEEGHGCLLSHTMGLGKTFTVLIFLAAWLYVLKSANPTLIDLLPEPMRRFRVLIICPPTLLDNWLEQIETWGDYMGLKTPIYINREVKAKSRLDYINTWNTADDSNGILLIGFDLFRGYAKPRVARAANPRGSRAARSRVSKVANPRVPRVPNPGLTEDEVQAIQSILLEQPRVVVADEAHQFRNPNVHIHEAVTEISTKRRIAMTGTPLSNNLLEYHSMINWVSPNYLQELTHFTKHYQTPIQHGLFYDSSTHSFQDSKRLLQQLSNRLDTKIHSRDISALDWTLPKKFEFIVTLPLTSAQKELYVGYIQAKEVCAHESRKGVFGWVAMLSRLTTHPKVLHEELAVSDKAAQDEDSHISAVDTTFSSSLSQQLLSTESAMEDVKHSAKTMIVFGILRFARAIGDKVLVFSQYTTVLNYLEKTLKNAGFSCSRVDGTVSPGKRLDLVNRFNAEGTPWAVFLLSTTTASQGFNITGANRVITFDHLWNPSVDLQAVGRAFRLGQKKNVYVYHLSTGGTYEEQVHNTQIFKQQLAARTIDGLDIKHAAGSRKMGFVEPVEVEQMAEIDKIACQDPDILARLVASGSYSIRKLEETKTYAEVWPNVAGGSEEGGDGAEEREERGRIGRSTAATATLQIGNVNIDE